MYIAIVDDIRKDRELLEHDIRNFYSGIVKIVSYASAEEFIRDIPRFDGDLVFLDICMDGMNGIELARKLRENDPYLLIVFLSSSADFAFDAFPVHPFDYIIKPYTEEKLAHVLKEASRLKDASVPMAAIKVPYRSLNVPMAKIISAVASGHTVEVTLIDGMVLKSIQTFKEIQNILSDDPRFLVINRGVLVNMDEVLSMDGENMRMKSGAVYPLRLRGRIDLISAFSHYVVTRRK